MKIAFYILTLTISLLVTGCSCSDSPQPIDSGVPIDGIIWKYPPASKVSENLGTPIPYNALVKVYDRLIVIQQADGIRQIVPLECITDLKLK